MQKFYFTIEKATMINNALLTIGVPRQSHLLIYQHNQNLTALSPVHEPSIVAKEKFAQKFGD